MLNGESGEKKGGKIVKDVFDAIVDSELKNNCTWTGKSATGKKTKIAFCNFEEIIKLIFAVVRRADGKYSLKECEYDLTYKVLI